MTRTPLILIVEDDSALSDSTKMALEFSGFDAAVAENGEVALELLETTVPNLILLDILMPVMDGREFLKRFKNDSNVPIIALSNLDSKHDIEEIISLGASTCLLKSSLTPMSLIDLVRQTIEAT